MGNASHGSAIPTADALAQAAAAASGKGLPPVERWNPPFCGDIDMEIRADGTWFYQGTPIGRKRLVRLFSTILKREGDSYFLVTPVEKVGIRVEDVPFVATDFEVAEEDGRPVLVFTTNVGDATAAGPGNPLRFTLDPETGEPTPYVHVRRGLEARIDRKSFYRLVERGETAEVDGEEWFGLRSGGAFFPIQRAEELAG
ncbi:MAG: DUF1285 domain-containing protein [Rubricella sp.]